MSDASSILEHGGRTWYRAWGARHEWASPALAPVAEGRRAPPLAPHLAPRAPRVADWQRARGAGASGARRQRRISAGTQAHGALLSGERRALQDARRDL